MFNELIVVAVTPFKGDAIESNRTKRIKDGDYVPSFLSTVTDHKTAKEVKTGTSQQGSSNLHEDDLKDSKSKVN